MSSFYLKKSIPVLVFFILLLNACTQELYLYSEKQKGYQIAIKNIYSPCCGWCSQKIIHDNLKGEQCSFTISCNVNNDNIGNCIGFGLGVQKYIYTYEGSLIKKLSIYNPVYDTTLLRNSYPNLFKLTILDTITSSKKLVPLDSTDSLIINKIIEYKSDSKCDKKYLKLIIGFILIKTEEVYLKKEKLK